MNSQRVARWAGLLLLAAALALYLVTLDNGLRPGELAGGDLITHQYAQVQARPSNAPGYPIYTMGGWLWFHALRALLGPAGNATAILSAYSTLWALLALALLYLLIRDLTTNWWISLLCTAFYGVTFYFWYYAVSTEQYTSAVAQTIAILLVAFRWDALQDRLDDSAGLTEHERTQLGRRSNRLLLLLAFLSGLALAHQVTVAFILPPLLWFILSRRQLLLQYPRLVAQAIGLALLPLLGYVFIYLRGAQHPEWRGQGQWSSTWQWFWDFVGTQQGRDELTWSLQPLWTAEFPSLIWQELTWVVFLGGLAGLPLLGKRRGIFIGSTLAIYLAFSFVDRLGNWYQVIMPAYALWIASFAVSAQWLCRRLASSRLSAPWPQFLTAAGLLALVALRFAGSLPEANQRDRPDDVALWPAQSMLADNPAPHAAVLGTYTETLSLRYLTDIQGIRSDVDVVGSPQARELLTSGARPLYATVRAVPIAWQEVSPEARLSSAGLALVELRLEPASRLPPEVQPLNMPVAPGLSLVGYAAQPWPLEDPTGLRVRLVWQADVPLAHDWSISVRPTLDGQLLTEAGEGILQADLPHPVHGMFPTSRWLSGEVVVDDYLLSGLVGQQADGLQIVVYRPVDDAFENLGVLSLPLTPLP